MDLVKKDADNISYIKENGNDSHIFYGDILEITISKQFDIYYITCNSAANSVRALELMDFILDNYGVEEGDAFFSEGKISSYIIESQLVEAGVEDINEFIILRLKKYFSDTMIIDTLAEGDSDKLISGMKLYKKKKIPWAVVKTTDIAEAGQNLIVHSLESTMGNSIQSGEDTYIMIGSKGEVYNIQRETFERTYEMTDKALNIFDSMLEYIPTVEFADSGEYVSIEEYATICYPLQGKKIFARECESRTKVYGKNNRDEYFLGRKGDYFVVREDDIKDGYIIKRDIFFDTYELCENRNEII